MLRRRSASTTTSGDVDGGYTRTLRSLPGPVWTISLGTFVNRFGGFAVVFLVLYLVEQGHSAAVAGAILAVYGTGQLAASLIGGWLADTVGRRYTIALSMFLGSGALLALAAARGVVRHASAPARTGIRRLPARAQRGLRRRSRGRGHSRLARVRPRLRRGRGDMRDLRGDRPRRAAGDPRRADGEQPRAASFGEVFGHRRFVAYVIASAAALTVYAQQQTGLPLHLESADFSAGTYGFLMSLNAALVIAFEVALIGLVRRYRQPQVIAVGYLLIGSGMALTGAAASGVVLAVTVVVWTVGEMITFPTAHAFLSAVAPARLRARYVGVAGFGFGVANVVAPIAGGTLYAVSPRLLWTACFVVSALAALTVVAAAPRPAGDRGTTG